MSGGHMKQGGPPLTPPPPMNREAESVNKVMADMKEEFLHCEICYEDKASSRLFTCGHSFCSSCTEHFHNKTTSERKVKVPHIECPMCRQWTRESDIKGDFRNYQLRDFQQRVAAEITNKRRCDLCHEKTTVSAKNYGNVCLACNLFLCHACLGNHEKMCDKKSIEINTRALLDTLICSVHAANIKTYYCETCEMSLCPVCVWHKNGHKDHTLLKHQDKLDKTRQNIDAKFSQYRRKRQHVSERKNEIVVKGRTNSVSRCAFQMLDEIDAREQVFLVERKQLLESAPPISIAETCHQQLFQMELELNMCDATLRVVCNEQTEDNDCSAHIPKRPRIE